MAVPLIIGKSSERVTTDKQIGMFVAYGLMLAGQNGSALICSNLVIIIVQKRVLSETKDITDTTVLQGFP